MASVENSRAPWLRAVLILLACCCAGVAISPRQALASNCTLVAMEANFCKRCTTHIPASTSRDVACYGQPPALMGGQETIMVESRIAKPPRNGRVRLEGRVWHYTPKKGFVGKDPFTIERAMLRGGQLFVIYLQFDMDVKP